MPTSVILLKTHSQEYETTFNAHGYHPHFIQVLETYLITGELSQILSSSPDSRFSGVIITSARAVDAWKASLPHSSWSSVPFYSVGKTTSQSLSQAFPSYDIRGQSGTSEKLAQFIIDDTKRHKDTKLPLLYLTGDKTRSTMSTLLSEAGIPSQEINVYETRQADDLERQIETATSDMLSPVWVVFFAPSSSQMALPFLHQIFELAPASQADVDVTPSEVPGPVARVAAIGPTTATHLREVEGIHVQVVPESPQVDLLVEKMKWIDEQKAQ